MCLKAAISCPIRTIPLLIKDKSTVTRRLLNRACSQRRRMALGPAAKAAQRRPRRPLKKSTRNAPAKPVWVNWPILLPHELFDAFIQAGLYSEVSLACQINSCFSPKFPTYSKHSGFIYAEKKQYGKDQGWNHGLGQILEGCYL